MSVSPPNRPGFRPKTPREVLARSFAFLSVIGCVLIGMIAWRDAHVTYALPNAVGHDLLIPRLVASVVAWVMAVAAFIAALLTSVRATRWVWLCAAALAVAVVVNLVTMAGPAKVY